jgi:hypothetical protein
MEHTLGSVLGVSGSHMTVVLDAGAAANALRVGDMVKVRDESLVIVGNVSSLSYDQATPDRRLAVVDLLGEIVGSGPQATFQRGISRYPAWSSAMFAADGDDLTVVYGTGGASGIRVGSLYHDADRPAFVKTDDLLAKHFAILGSTGSGKSCAVTLLLSSIIERHPNAHVILLDPHNEYAGAFGEIAENINVDNLRLPFWLFDLEEAVRVLVRGGSQYEQESQALILKDVMTRARRAFAGSGVTSSAISVDTPVPYRIPDLVRFLNESMGRLDKADTSMPYLRLRTRLESLRDDRRFAFMFTDWFDTPDCLSELMGRVLRIPVGSKPISIIDLSGLPSEITDVVVSLSCRMIFDFALWSDRRNMPPLLIVCEEAHRYVPSDERIGFAATSRAITRIAKEGRKYGVSLALVSQRPSELSADALSQCGTVFALRMANEPDQKFVERVLPEAAHGMVDSLQNLRTQDTIISGEAVGLPMRVRFDDLAAERRPHSESAHFSESWQNERAGEAFRDDAIRRWRMQSRHEELEDALK